MLNSKLLFVLATCLSLSHCKQDKYCAICPDHTMCTFHGPGEACENIGGSGVTHQEKEDIVDLHNWLRKVVATGYEAKGVSGPQPKASNLMKLTWDDELANVAQTWADQCLFQHDRCRNVERWPVGQNIYWKWKYPNHHVNWTEAIFSWYDEVALFNATEVQSYRFEPATGHYTQLLWHDTYAIGCGRRDYGKNKLYVCNYGPSGNWIEEPLYSIGEPCSNCPQGSVCENSLCVFQKISHKKQVSSEIESTGVDVSEVTTKNISTETKNKTENHENPKENSESVKTDVEKAKHCRKNEQKEKQKEVLHKVHESFKSNSVEESRIELDEEIQNEIADIKLRIEKLVKNAIKRSKLKH